MAIPLVGSPPPAKNYEQLLSADSSTFAAGVGSWTATGGAVTRDTTAGHRIGNLTASLKWASTTSTTVLNCAIPGVFKAGFQYEAFVALKVEESPAGTRGVQVHLGVVGTDSASTQLGFGSGQPPHANSYVGAHVKWVPTADRTSVQIRVIRTTTDNLAETFHIGYALVSRTPGPGTLLDRVQIGGLTGLFTGGSFISGWELRSLSGPDGEEGASISVDDRQSEMWGGWGGPDEDISGVIASGVAGGAGGSEVTIYGPHPAASRAQFGHNIEVGEDYVGLYISERNSTTVEVYPDFGDYDIVLLDGDDSAATKHWAHETADGVQSRLGSWFEQEFRVAGALTATTNVAPYWRVPYNARIDEVFCHVGTAPTGQALIVDVNDDGTTVFTTQGNRPQIAVSTNDDTSGIADGGTTILKDSVITIDVDQVGSGVAGSDLYVSIRGRYRW